MTTGTAGVSGIMTKMTAQSLGLAKALLEGVKAGDFARQPELGGTRVDTNHPAFIYGHLAIYPSMIAAAFGIEASEIDAPEGYMALFENGVECTDDADGTKYPPMDEVVAYFEKSHAFIVEKLRALDDAAFMNEIDDSNERAREFFGTTGSMAVFMLHDHLMFHLGQMSAWRRCMGLGHAM